MTDPNLPEGVTQRDIDRTVGETFDPNTDSENCKHGYPVYEECAVEEMGKENLRLRIALENIASGIGKGSPRLTHEEDIAEFAARVLAWAQNTARKALSEKEKE